MEALAAVEEIQHDFEKTADVHRVFGDPVQVGTKTVVPVAHVEYGFGGGMGKGEGQGMGGGGRVKARPVGVVELTETETKFIPILDPGVVVSAVKAGVFGFMLGLMLRRR